MSMRRLLAIRDVRVYLVGQVFSMLGDSALWLAMGVWIKDLTNSDGAAGLTFFFFTAPTVLTPAAGLLVDRVRKRPLLLATNVVTGCAVLLLLFVRSAHQIWLIYLVMVLYGLTYALLGVAQSALLEEIAPAELLADANAFLRTAQEMLRLVGPLVGSGLFLLAGGHVVALLDALTFLVPVGCLFAVRHVEPLPQTWQRHWWAEMLAGIRFVARSGPLRQIVLATGCALFVFGFNETTLFAIAGQGLHRPPAFVGVLIAVQGAGGVLAGPPAAPLIRRWGEARLVGTGLLAAAAGAALEMSPLLPAVVAGLLLIGMSLPWIVVGLFTQAQRTAPSAVQGRVFAAAFTLVSVPQAVSIAVGAALIGVLPYPLLLGTTAVVIALSAVYLLSRPWYAAGRGGRPG